MKILLSSKPAVFLDKVNFSSEMLNYLILHNVYLILDRITSCLLQQMMTLYLALWQMRMNFQHLVNLEVYSRRVKDCLTMMQMTR